MAMSLATPEKIRTLQRKLYLKAKAEPAFRFYLLYDKIGRTDILEHAYALVRANGGAPGVDGESFAVIETAGPEGWLAGIRKDLALKTYRPLPVRRVMIPKPGGRERPFGIPTIRDRVVQTAAKLVLEPIFEADLDPAAYGYRPGWSATDAIKAVHGLLCSQPDRCRDRGGGPRPCAGPSLPRPAAGRPCQRRFESDPGFVGVGNLVLTHPVARPLFPRAGTRAVSSPFRSSPLAFAGRAGCRRGACP